MGYQQQCDACKKAIPEEEKRFLIFEKNNQASDFTKNQYGKSKNWILCNDCFKV